FFTRIHVDLTAAQVRIPEVPLLQSLAILVKNACEASEPGLPIFVKAETSVNRLCLTVSDRGSGMAPEVVARLGEPFFTTKEPGFGMGLGLFVVRTFVERMRGKLEIDSEPGRGTTIRLVFPSGREGEDDD